MIELAMVPVFLPLATFGVLAVLWPVRHSGMPAAWLSVVTAIASCVAAILAWSGAPIAGEPAVGMVFDWLVHDGKTIAEVGFRLDAISAPMLVVVTFVAACVQVYSLGYMAHEPRPALGRYFAWHSLFIVAMSGMVLAPNMLQFLGCWELVGLCSYLLIGFYWDKPSAGRAAVKAVWVTRFADIGLMSGVVLLYVTTGGFEFEMTGDSGAATLVAALLFCGVMGKSAQVPLHVWLPDAMEGPTPVSALLHAATMVAAGVFLVVRAWPIFEAAPPVLTAMTWIGAVTALVAACTALVQHDIKKVLAYSTCSQLGYMVAALGTGSFFGGYFHLTTHAFFKALLFLGAGSVIHAVGTNDLREMGGLAKKTKLTAALFVLGSLALAGVPPLSGFFSKDLVLEELFHAHAYGPLLLCLAAAALTAFYMTRVVCMAFLGPASARSLEAHESPPVMLLPMAALAALATVAGFTTGRFGDDVAGAPWHFALTAPGIAALVLALGGIALAYVKYGQGKLEGLGVPALATFIRSGPVDGLFVRGWQQGLRPFAGMVGWVDRYVVDGAVNLLGWAALVGSERMRGLQTGKLRDASYLLVVGALFVVAWGAIGGVR